MYARRAFQSRLAKKEDNGCINEQKGIRVSVVRRTDTGRSN